MQASNLINSINQALNEDAYSKYTIPQLYIKLGQEKCFDYIKNICLTIIRREKIEVLDGAEIDADWASRHSQNPYCVVYLTAKREHYYNGLKVFFGRDYDMWVTGMVHDKNNVPDAESKPVIITRDTSNIYEPLKKAIKRVSRSVRLEKWRKKLDRLGSLEN